MNFLSLHTLQTHDTVVKRLALRIAEDNAIIAASNAKCAMMLTEAVHVAFTYARNLADALGEPLVLNRSRASWSAIGPILFDSLRDAVDALRNSTNVRAVFADRQARKCVFLLTMHRHEYVIFGTEIQGEIVQRDVMQDAVEFRTIIFQQQHRPYQNYLKFWQKK